MAKALFVNRISIGFSDEQFIYLCDQVKDGQAEGIAQFIRKLVNRSLEARIVADENSSEAEKK